MTRPERTRSYYAPYDAKPELNRSLTKVCKLIGRVSTTTSMIAVPNNSRHGIEAVRMPLISSTTNCVLGKQTRGEEHEHGI